MARLYDLGYSQAQVIERLRVRWPEASPNVIYAAERRGREAYRAGNFLNVSFGGGTVPAGEIPSGGTAGRGYVYYTRAELTGGPGDASLVRAITVRSQTNLTRDQIEAEARRMVAETYGQRATRRGYEEYVPDIVEGSFSVVGVERR